MNWTSPSDIKHQVQKLWDQRKILAALVQGESLFPLRLKLKAPSSKELSGEFAAVRDWINDLKRWDGERCRIVWRTFNHRVMGRNSVPKEIWIDTLDLATSLIRKHAEVKSFVHILRETRERHPTILPWLERNPLKALELVVDWSRLLDVIDWIIQHPRPGIYLRQVDVSGVHSKFIESHRHVLSELFDLALPPESIFVQAAGVKGFCRRYGFRDKPTRIRFRILEPAHAIFTSSTDQDIAVNHDTFSTLDLPARRIFITENEINYLSFPGLADCVVIFGAGYGFEMLAQATWLCTREVFYWGDIDTHGFAILDQLRSQFDHAQSFLMDRETLLAHRALWDKEPKPEGRQLSRLHADEAELYDDLRENRLGQQVRLEQERIGFTWLYKALDAL